MKLVCTEESKIQFLYNNFVIGEAKVSDLSCSFPFEGSKYTTFIGTAKWVRTPAANNFVDDKNITINKISFTILGYDSATEGYAALSPAIFDLTATTEKVICNNMKPIRLEDFGSGIGTQKDGSWLGPVTAIISDTVQDSTYAD